MTQKRKKVEKNWTKIYSSNNPINAEIIKQMLEESGINTVDINQQDSSYNMFGNIHLYVHQELYRKATELIKKYNNDQLS